MESKYKNKKIEIDGFKFDSKKEGNRYLELILLLKAKKITDLYLQPDFILQDSFKDKNGKHHRKISYIGDFKYVINGETFVEDSKGFKTDIFRLKLKLLLFKYPDINFIIS